MKQFGNQERKGAAAVEFALVLPVFFLLVIGIIELGRALMVQQILTNASRAGARVAVTPDATSAITTSTTSGYAANAAVPGISVNVSPDPAAAGSGSLVTVTASVDYSQISWLPSPWFLGGTTLSASSVMRKEGFD